MSRPYILSETNWKTVQQTDYEVVVLPWGATEAHNLHLPYGTDNIQSDYIAAEAARIAWENDAKVIILPTIPFGVNTGQLHIPLDINMNPSTQLFVLKDVADSISRQGFKKLLILNGHGGNDFKAMIRELQPQFPNTFICVLNWYQLIDLYEIFEDPGDHGGEMETSNLMVIAPDFVLPLEEAGDGKEYKFTLKGLKEKWAWAPRDFSKATHDNGIGDPSKATFDKGEQHLKIVTEKIASFFIDLSQCADDDLYEK